jgi:hypothetical protein
MMDYFQNGNNSNSPPTQIREYTHSAMWRQILFMISETTYWNRPLSNFREIDKMTSQRTTTRTRIRTTMSRIDRGENNFFESNLYSGFRNVCKLRHQKVAGKEREVEIECEKLRELFNFTNMVS